MRLCLYERPISMYACTFTRCESFASHRSADNSECFFFHFCSSFIDMRTGWTVVNHRRFYVVLYLVLGGVICFREWVLHMDVLHEIRWSWRMLADEIALGKSHDLGAAQRFAEWRGDSEMMVDLGLSQSNGFHTPIERLTDVLYTHHTSSVMTTVLHVVNGSLKPQSCL